ncbi:hypothetical protein [Photobacterium leiognathi]|uniref:hypothetical protein n=1 Tax=Photobacterium leiognathi TaxID=553611 RepID=UPI002982B2EC|nr:hypothetical protein [Photobacterium leiognathi]
MKKLLISAALLLGSITGCTTEEQWSCVEDGTLMYSISESGKLGGAENGCSCEDMYNFEVKLYGINEVDTEHLNSTFGCNFPAE